MQEVDLTRGTRANPVFIPSEERMLAVDGGVVPEGQLERRESRNVREMIDIHGYDTAYVASRTREELAEELIEARRMAVINENRNSTKEYETFIANRPNVMAGVADAVIEREGVQVYPNMQAMNRVARDNDKVRIVRGTDGFALVPRKAFDRAVTKLSAKQAKALKAGEDVEVRLDATDLMSKKQAAEYTKAKAKEAKAAEKAKAKEATALKKMQARAEKAGVSTGKKSLALLTVEVERAEKEQGIAPPKKTRTNKPKPTPEPEVVEEEVVEEMT
jgi:hypothetical protein